MNAVSGVPGEPETFYFGSVGGGLWKSSNAGRTWVPVFDSQPVASIGAIGVAPSNPAIIYVGTGEADMRDSIAFGNGMYKSVDAGLTWKHIGLDADPPDRPRPGPSEELGRRLRRGPRPCLRPQPRPGRVPLSRRRRDVAESPVQDDEPRGGGPGARSRRPEDHLCRDVGHPPSALVRLRALERPRRRHL